jgi:hypothetical protein
MKVSGKFFKLWINLDAYRFSSVLVL